jgi:hypothetical protein
LYGKFVILVAVGEAESSGESLFSFFIRVAMEVFNVASYYEINKTTSDALNQKRAWSKRSASTNRKLKIP